ncbi:MAG: sulfurtransferase TusA family protein [Magnetococcales bacterium]|nr:sulfurtransferase TusA family protein [Magnetococcales bacterium]MBF0438844.1 sulfurtransferase TusA family protein [Magnetococcales bacterium]
MITPDDHIDITHESCPMTFVLVKLKLESMAPGQRLRIRLNGGEPLANLPRTLQDEGCLVSAPWEEAGAFGILVTKPEAIK